MKKITLFLMGLFLLGAVQTFGQGCMEPSSDEGVSVIGFLQPEFQMKETSDGWTNSFAFRRARLGVTGNVPYDFSYYFMVDFSRYMPDSPYLLDAFITYNRFSFAKFTIGQYKPPFSQELNTACHKLYTIQRSKVVNELALPNRDQGLMMWGSFAKSIVNYNVAIMNDYRRGFYDENNNKAFVGRVTIQPWDFLRFGGSFKTSVTGSNSDNDVTRYAGELQVTWKGLLLQAEYIWGEDTGSYTTGGGCDGTPIEIHEGPITRGGMYAILGYMTPINLQPIVKFETYDPDTSDGSQFETAFTGGLNYFFNDWTRLQVNYSYRAEGDNEVPNDCFLVQMQINF